MGMDHRLFSRLQDFGEYSGNTIFDQTIIEISSDSRVLIEKHFGVREYSRNIIVVNVKYGLVKICGECLELRQMTKEQLVISGRISSISLCRRN